MPWQVINQLDSTFSGRYPPLMHPCNQLCGLAVVAVWKAPDQDGSPGNPLPLLATVEIPQRVFTFDRVPLC